MLMMDITTRLTIGFNRLSSPLIQELASSFTSQDLSLIDIDDHIRSTPSTSPPPLNYLILFWGFDHDYPSPPTLSSLDRLIDKRTKFVICFPSALILKSPSHGSKILAEFGHFLKWVGQVSHSRNVHFKLIFLPQLFDSRGPFSLSLTQTRAPLPQIVALDSQTHLTPLSLTDLSYQLAKFLFSRHHRSEAIILSGPPLISSDNLDTISSGSAIILPAHVPLLPQQLILGSHSLPPVHPPTQPSPPPDHRSPSASAPVSKKTVKRIVRRSPSKKTSSKPTTPPSPLPSKHPFFYVRLLILFIAFLLTLTLPFISFLILGHLPLIKPELLQNHLARIDSFSGSLYAFNRQLLDGCARTAPFSLICRPGLDIVDSHHRRLKTLIATRKLEETVDRTLASVFTGKSVAIPTALNDVIVNIGQHTYFSSPGTSPPEIGQGRVTQILQALRHLTSLPQATILVLLQNDLELRPTGGFISAVAVMEFEQGALTGSAVYDIYDLDGRLSGSIAPPAQIAQALKETQWYFRDANWDPDFFYAASQANWFLEKVLGTTADIIVGLNTRSLSGLIDGGLVIADPTLGDITASNLRSKAFSSQDVVFGSLGNQQQEFIQHLFQQLVSQLDQPFDYPLLARNFLLGLINKEITLASPNLDLQRSLVSAGIAGTLVQPTCPQPQPGQICIADLTHINEANIGINKINYYLERQITHTVEVGERQIRRRSLINLKNTAPTHDWPAGSYRAYVRAIIPLNSIQVQISLAENKLSPSLTNISSQHGLKSVGFPIEVPVGQALDIVLSYILPVNSDQSPTTYLGSFIKQPGTGNYPVVINIIDPTSDPLGKDLHTGIGFDHQYSYTQTQDTPLLVEFLR